MSTYRSYFSKNTTLITGNTTNNSQNPVTEISYGRIDKKITRFIFDVDLDDLSTKFSNGLYSQNRIVSHVLHMTNTISTTDKYIGKTSYSENIQRATSFELELFNVNEDWDEGGGYTFYYDETPLTISQASNWIERKTNINWANEGVYVSGGTGATQIIGSQLFDKGNENISIDITNYINQKIFGTGYTGTTAYSGDTYGLGIKYTDIYEQTVTEFLQAVAFHTKYTNTWFEPYIETTIDDTITDDRNYFYLNKDNDLYFYVTIGNVLQNITINSVEIYDYNDVLFDVLSGSSILNVSNGIYKITLNISSDEYPDAVLFKDKWNVTINGRDTSYSNEFYLISQDNYFVMNQPEITNFDNYFFNYYGISHKEKIVAGNIRKIKLNIRELYSEQNKFMPLDIEYRLFTTIGDKYEIDVIPYTSVNRTSSGYEFNIDTSWLIPQDYKLQIRMRSGNYYRNKETISFTIVSTNPFND